MKVIIDQDIPLAENVRLIKRLYKVDKNKDYPDGLKFAFQYLLFNGADWIELCRIDNYKHSGKGVHIHKIGKKKVQFKEMNFEEAEEYVMSLGDRIRRTLDFNN